MGRRSKRPACIVAGFVIAAFLPAMALAAVKEEVIERYRATATRARQPAYAKRLEVVVYRWTTPQEREEIVETLVGPADQTSVDVLNRLDVVGRIKTPGEPGIDLIYLWSVEQDEKHYVVGVVRPYRVEASSRWPRRPYTSEPENITFYTPYVSMFQLELDESGTGAGILAPALYPKFESNGTVQMETGTADLIQLTGATRR